MLFALVPLLPVLPVLLGAPPMALSLRDAVHAAVEHNLDLLQQRLETRRLETLESAAWWGYTPELTLSTSVDDQSAPASGTPTRVAASSVGVGWTAPVGTSVGAELRLDRDLVGPSAQNDGALILSVRQPLLKGAWLSGASQPLTEASLASKIGREAFRSELEGFCVEVETAYWDLALAQADVAIKTRSLERAKEQHADTAENIKRGILADVEIYVVEENLVFFETELARAQEARTQARRRVAALLWLDPAVELIASDDLNAPLDLAEPSASAVLDATLAESPFLAEQRLRQELALTREHSVAVNALPQLDLDGTLALGATGDTKHPAIGGVLSTPSPEARVGLTFSMPLGPPPVRASVQAAHIAFERERLELQSRELHVRHDVERSVGQVALSMRLASLGKKQLDLAELKLTAQNDKYRNGISTLADVVRFQRELDEASISLRRSVRDVHVSRAQLQQQQGRLAASFGVAVQ